MAGGGGAGDENNNENVRATGTELMLAAKGTKTIAETFALRLGTLKVNDRRVTLSITQLAAKISPSITTDAAEHGAAKFAPDTVITRNPDDSITDGCTDESDGVYDTRRVDVMILLDMHMKVRAGARDTPDPALGIKKVMVVDDSTTIEEDCTLKDPIFADMADARQVKPAPVTVILCPAVWTRGDIFEMD